MTLKGFPPCFDWCLNYLLFHFSLPVVSFRLTLTTHSLMKAIDCYFKWLWIPPLHTSSHFAVVIWRGFMDSLRSIPESHGPNQALTTSSNIFSNAELRIAPPKCHAVSCFVMLPYTTPVCPIFLMNGMKPSDLLFISLNSPLGLSSFSPHTHRCMGCFSPLWPYYILLLSKDNKLIQGRQWDLRLKKLGVRMTWVRIHSRSGNIC